MNAAVKQAIESLSSLVALYQDRGQLEDAEKTSWELRGWQHAAVGHVVACNESAEHFRIYWDAYVLCCRMQGSAIPESADRTDKGGAKW